MLAHSDFDTLIFASEDLELTRRLVRDYCDTQQSWMDAVDGTIGRRFVPGEIGWGYARNLADTLRGDGRATQAELDGWLAGLQRRSCAVSTTTPSSVVECPGDAPHATGATVRRPTSR